VKGDLGGDDGGGDDGWELEVETMKECVRSFHGCSARKDEGERWCDKVSQGRSWKIG